MKSLLIQAEKHQQLFNIIGRQRNNFRFNFQYTIGALARLYYHNIFQTKTSFALFMMETIANKDQIIDEQANSKIIPDTVECKGEVDKVMQFINSSSEQLLISKPLLARSFSQRPIGVKIVVKTEFVYTDSISRQRVELVGDWNGWLPITMSREEKDLWSTISILNTGYHEFYFLVDGVEMISKKHPQTDNGRRNWRNVHGPRGPITKNRSMFYMWAQNILEGFGLVTVQNEVYSNITLNTHLSNINTRPKKTSFLGKIAEFGWITTMLVTTCMYFVLVAVYTFLVRS